MRGSYVIGGRSRSVVTRDLGPVAIAGVKLDPRALRWLIGVPLAEFREATLALAELGNPTLLRLGDAVASARSAHEVAGVLDRCLIRALRDMPGAEPPVDRLLEQIHAERGSLSIRRWVRDHRMDARHLERRFCAAVGMTPKRYARIIRFKHSYHELLKSGATPRLSHLDGYYDQSHFNREFRSFIGAAPSARRGSGSAAGTSISDHLLAGELGSTLDLSLARHGAILG